ncbi:MAG: PrsW family intramembrane metalloprotease [Stigonema ocellatum SAG 48.90 = DSM 106950]|nr:PrsW family intramembrane metalloprotease [Stigonema ocellatum SAG 48.90 = DSM 106950]
MPETARYKGFLKQVNNSAASDSEQTQYVLSPDKTIVIGRDPSHCDIVLDSNDYPDISRQHLKISPLSSQSPRDMPVWEICDLGSRNGTYVNGQRLQGCQTLQLQDHIKIGNKGSEFIFQCEDANILSITDVFPLTSKKLDLHQKGYLLPGIITVLAVVGMLATKKDNPSFAYILVAYLVTASHYIIHNICHKHKPWWLLLSVALATGLPILGGLHFKDTSSEHSLPAILTSSFQVGLLVELFKALPVLLVYVLGRLLQSPKRELIGVWEPLDGILLGTACATAFALAETYLEVNEEFKKSSPEVFTLLIPRILGDISGEVAYSGCFGYFIGLSALKPFKRWQLLGIGYLISAAMHTLWEIVYEMLKNHTFLPSLVGNPLLALIGSLAYVFLVAAIVKANQLSPNNSHKSAAH